MISDLSNHLFEHNLGSARHNLFILHNEMHIPILTLYADFTYLLRVAVWIQWYIYVSAQHLVSSQNTLLLLFLLKKPTFHL